LGEKTGSVTAFRLSPLRGLFFFCKSRLNENPKDIWRYVKLPPTDAD